jgi:ribosome recycling factor
MIEDVIKDLRSEMEATVESLKRDLNRVRTGRANPALLDGIVVEYYGTPTALNKLASVNAPEGSLLVVQAYDQSALSAIDKAIRSSDLGLSPVNDGKILRVPIPALTEERRRDLVKQVRKEGEKHRVSVRNHRRDALDMLEALESEKEITEDDQRRATEKVEELTKDYVHKVDGILKAKEDEVMAV